MAKYKNWGQHCFVFWSGGKDSTVALHLALRAWEDFETVFIDIGISLPETLEYVRRMEKGWATAL